MNNLKKLFNSLQTDPGSILFMEERINDMLLKKLNKMTYEKDLLSNLFNENNEEVFEEKKPIPTKIPLDKKKMKLIGPPFTALIDHFNF